MRYILLTLPLLLASCSRAQWISTQTDSSCVRTQMLAGTNGNALPFSAAVRHCGAITKGKNVPQNMPAPRPVDLRDDTTLQAMAENPDYNTESYPYVPRASKAPMPGGLWSTNFR